MNVQATNVQELQSDLEQIEARVDREGLSDDERVRRAKKAFLKKLGQLNSV